MAIIEFISRLLHHYVVICVALAVIPLKLMMIRLSRDRSGEVETLLGIPEDLCYVTLGLLLSSVTSDTGPLRLYFGHSPYPKTNAGILLFLNFVLAFVVHKIAHRWTKPQYQTYRAALELRINYGDDNQALSLIASEDHLLQIFLHHFWKLLFSTLFQLALAGFWLYWIARIYGAR